MNPLNPANRATYSRSYVVEEESKPTASSSYPPSCSVRMPQQHPSLENGNPAQLRRATSLTRTVATKTILKGSIRPIEYEIPEDHLWENVQAHHAMELAKSPAEKEAIRAAEMEALRAAVIAAERAHDDAISNRNRNASDELEKALEAAILARLAAEFPELISKAERRNELWTGCGIFPEFKQSSLHDKAEALIDPLCWDDTGKLNRQDYEIHGRHIGRLSKWIVSRERWLDDVNRFIYENEIMTTKGRNPEHPKLMPFLAHYYDFCSDLKKLYKEHDLNNTLIHSSDYIDTENEPHWPTKEHEALWSRTSAILDRIWHRFLMFPESLRDPKKSGSPYSIFYDVETIAITENQMKRDGTLSVYSELGNKITDVFGNQEAPHKWGRQYIVCDENNTKRPMVNPDLDIDRLKRYKCMLSLIHALPEGMQHYFVDKYTNQQAHEFDWSGWRNYTIDQKAKGNAASLDQVAKVNAFLDSPCLSGENPERDAKLIWKMLIGYRGDKENLLNGPQAYSEFKKLPADQLPTLANRLQKQLPEATKNFLRNNLLSKTNRYYQAKDSMHRFGIQILNPTHKKVHDFIKQVCDS